MVPRPYTVYCFLTASVLMKIVHGQTLSSILNPCSVPKNARLLFESDCSWACVSGFVKDARLGVCYPSAAPKGHYAAYNKTGDYTFEACPTVANVVYTSNYSNNCQFPRCVSNGSMTMSRVGAERAQAACAFDPASGSLSSTCKSVLSTLCRNPCPAGQVLLRELKSYTLDEVDNSPILDSRGYYQCIKAPQCPPGSYMLREGVGGYPPTCVDLPSPIANGTAYVAAVRYTWPLALIATWRTSEHIFPIVILKDNSAPFRPEFDVNAGRFTKALSLLEYFPCGIDGMVVDVTCVDLACSNAAAIRVGVCQCPGGFSNFPKCDASCNASVPLSGQSEYTRGCDTRCRAGWYRPPGQPACAFCSTKECANTEWASPCSPTQDASCNTCTVCKAGEYEVQACSPTSDTVCRSCTTCANDALVQAACTAKSDTVCTGCADCPTGTYAAQTCSGQTGTQCAPCTECPYGTYERVPCSATQNRYCERCPTRPPVNGRFGPNCEIVCNSGFKVTENYCTLEALEFKLNSATVTRVQLLQTLYQDPECYVEMWKQTLSRYYAAPTFIAEISHGDVVVSCDPVPCICKSSLRRRMLQAVDNAPVTITYSYPGDVQSSWDLQRALPNAVSVIEPGSKPTPTQCDNETSKLDTIWWVLTGLLGMVVGAILFMTVSVFCFYPCDGKTQNTGKENFIDIRMGPDRDYGQEMSSFIRNDKIGGYGEGRGFKPYND